MTVTSTTLIQGTGGSDTVQVTGTATDAAGDVFVTGYVEGTVNFGSGQSLTADSGRKILFAAKYSSTGALDWVKNAVETSTYSVDPSIAVTADGNTVYLGGTVYESPGNTTGTTTFAGGATLSPNSVQNAYVLKFDGSGNYQWLSEETGGYVQVGNVSVDSHGGVVLGMNEQGGDVFTPASGSPVTLDTLDGSHIADYAFNLTAGGAINWQAELPTSFQAADVTATAVDSAGNIYFAGTGEFAGGSTLTVGGSSVSVAGNSQIGGFLAKISADGTPQWVQELNSTTGDSVFFQPSDVGGVIKSIAFDSNGPVVTGYYTNGTTLAGTTYSAPTHSYYGTNYSATRAFVEQFGSDGSQEWAQAQTGSGNGFDQGTDVVVDAAGNIVVSGYFQPNTWGSTDSGGEFTGETSATLPGNPGGAFDLSGVANYSNEAFIWSQTPGSGSATPLFAGVFPADGSDRASLFVGTGAAVTAILSGKGLIDVDPSADTTNNIGTAGTDYGVLVPLQASDIHQGNTAPSGTDGSVGVTRDQSHAFAASEFGFSDVDGNSLLAVEITTLPGAGSLTDNGVTVSPGQFIPLADIAGGLLVYTPGSAPGPTGFTFQVQDDGGIANSGHDTDATPNTLNIYVQPDNDFNGDGNSDLLWLNSAANKLSVWEMTNPGYTPNDLGNALPAGWSVVGTADFNNDGKSDILLQNNMTDKLVVWQMNGFQHTSVALDNLGDGSKAVGIGDFNDDGHPDVVFQNVNNGKISVRLAEGSGLSAGVVVANRGTDWSVVGTGDFNGDGQSDILLRSSITGRVDLVAMNGSDNIPADSGAIGGNLSWNVVATGDLNGDGKTDVILQNPNSSEVSVWIMDGTTRTLAADIATPGAGWTVTGSADFNNDGNADILLQNASGQAQIWYMNGTTMLPGSGLIGPARGADLHVMAG